MLNKLVALDLHLLESNQFGATSYIPLPQGVRNSRAVINIQNKDEKCFLWSVIAGIYEDSHERYCDRVFNYIQHEKEFNLHGISFPMALKDIPKFEKLIKVISCNVGRLKFLDSMQFLSCSLDKLAEQLSDDQLIH